ncbi:unnamed protein product [Dracunculus medinensis]|uniref:Mitochondrial ribosomal protein s17 n=1 Tax=Dracunculus medinensis TaxID=318479 RepID=A0A0N4UF56_DRAME|nr:unnamed protein product [Dracunculus medinensis]
MSVITNETDMLLGKVVQITDIGLDKIHCVQVRCRQNEFDLYLKKFFVKSGDFWATDTKTHCGLGDIVLIKKPTEKPPQQRITHEVMKIIFKFGYIIDPVTKKRVVRDSFDDEFEFRTRVDALLFDEQSAIQHRRLLERKNSIENNEEL